jgi:hypothetical protein
MAKRLDIAAVKRRPKGPDPRHVKRAADLLAGRGIAEFAREIDLARKLEAAATPRAEGPPSALARALKG